MSGSNDRGRAFADSAAEDCRTRHGRAPRADELRAWAAIYEATARELERRAKALELERRPRRRRRPAAAEE